MNESGAAGAGRTYLRLVLVGALIGIPAALLAAGFLALVHELEQPLWDDLPEALALLVGTAGLDAVPAAVFAAAAAWLTRAALDPPKPAMPQPR
jgi:hypothetical protein